LRGGGLKVDVRTKINYKRNKKHTLVVFFDNTAACNMCQQKSNPYPRHTVFFGAFTFFEAVVEVYNPKLSTRNFGNFERTVDRSFSSFEPMASFSDSTTTNLRLRDTSASRKQMDGHK
jgi:hypothetical protein